MGWFLGVLFVYSALLGVGYLVLGKPFGGILLIAFSTLSALGAIRIARTAHLAS